MKPSVRYTDINRFLIQHNCYSISVCSVFVVFIITLVFINVYYFEFINYDDDFLLTRNMYVNSGLSLKNIIWAFTSTDKLQWVPLTWISHMIDFNLYGMKPYGHHLTNVFLHILNSLLLLTFLTKATGKFWNSIFVVLLFALHPLHVEPVAWVAARKDVLSTFFCFLTLILYLYYVKQPSLKRYLLIIGTYLLSLASKPMMITLPLILLFLDYWPLQRFDSIGKDNNRLKLGYLLIEKIPLIILSLVFSVIAYIAQSNSNAISSIELVPINTRIVNSLTAYATYIFKVFWPYKLALIYPINTTHSMFFIFIAFFVLLLISFFSIRYFNKYRFFIVGWSWFLVTLLPVIGFVQIGSAYMADKFTYVPLIGIFVIIVWGSDQLFVTLGSNKNLLFIIGLLFISALTIRSWLYLQTWQNSKTIYESALSCTENNFLVLYNLGAVYQNERNYAKALELYSQSISAEPRFESGYYGIGWIYQINDQCEKALEYYEYALKLKPDYGDAKRGINYCRYRLSLT